MEKVEQYERVFSRFNSDGDGRISPEKLHCIASIGGGMVAAEAEVAVVLSDSEGDGLLSLEDFMKVVKGAGEEEKQSDLKAAFEL
ncbi:hypothetical protein SASPL_108523 [Salvia splendens]|uniref:EF-hand domain-containing protein n=1 Tax=Salvia splendens TaxID=180675 RepID=A0A8X8YCE7_SALSN|nr:hypothetical protein SASPL_108523 [Salvia splendens]